MTSVLSLLLMAVAALVLAGWSLDLAALKGVGGPITMKANAAIALMAAGLALRLRASDRPLPRVVGRTCAVLAGIVGGLTLSEHVIGWNLGIDELLFREAPGAAATTSPGRMGPNASLSLTVGAVALWWLYDGGPRAVARAQIVGAVIAVFALVPVVGYLYGATQLYAVARYTGIAFHTGLALVALAVGILAARPDTGPVASLLTEAPHGVLARRLLALGIALPLALGFVRLVGERRGWFDAGFGTAVFVVCMIVLFTVTTWQTTVALGHSEDARWRAQRDRDDLLVRDRDAAERADRAKDDFIASLSHELRTPINAIVGWAQLLRHEGTEETTRAKAIDAVCRNASALTRLVDDLLDTARLARGHLELSQGLVDVNAVARAALESLTPAAVAKNVRFTIVPEPAGALVIGDAQRLQQVLWNLLSNAVKFSPADETVVLEVTADAATVVLHVRDNGEGIPPDFLPRVFDKFEQGPMANRGSGSLGLGLHIAKHLIERHGGSIQAQSDGVGSGSVFTIRLPRADSRMAGGSKAAGAVSVANASPAGPT
jgi:signal transduction histidine kinase